MAATFSMKATNIVRSISLQHSLCRPRAASSSLIVRCTTNDSSNNNEQQPEPSSSDPEFKGFGQPPSSSPEKPISTAEALRESLGGVSNAQGRVARSTNVVLGINETEEKWRELDEQVNEYPGQREFKVIGSGGDDFVMAMTACVAAHVGTVHEECVTSRLSSGGKWVSVTIGPVWVEEPAQMLAIYDLMREDGRLKYFI